MQRTQSPQGRGEGSPASQPEGTPAMFPMDHSWTLQAVMEMQKSIGILGEKVDRLREDVGGLGVKIDANCEKVTTINTRLAYVAGGAAVLMTIAVVIWSLINLVPWSRITIAPPAGVATPKP